MTVEFSPRLRLRCRAAVAGAAALARTHFSDLLGYALEYVGCPVMRFALLCFAMLLYARLG